MNYYINESSDKMKVLRLDKYLADMSVGTRSEVKKYINNGKIKINDIITKDSSTKINPSQDIVSFDNNIINYIEFTYYMLNKPQGVVTAVKDFKDKTVMDLIESTAKNLSPVGRLDKDTEGLLLITNNGELAHNLLSPKKHVDKEYYVLSKSPLSDEDMIKLETGVYIEKDKLSAPAKIKKGDEINSYYLTIQEGKFHQVKKMFHGVKNEVIFLKRIRMGSLCLDQSLMPGQYRPLSENEIRYLIEGE